MHFVDPECLALGFGLFVIQETLISDFGTVQMF